ncbi:MAG: aspartate/glutamate racemase family protein [Phenylobacterium sp.]|uniref:aspartate/glutamate racemase family protein n=1 Tax=Phenylobacterium sp. TaxID=1871053 RepID=UPI0039191114
MSLVLGLLGGMGPAATVDFLAKLQALTPAERDQDHIRVLVDLNPQAPDRNTDSTAAGLELADMAQGLAGAGAEVLAIACNTAHAHARDVQQAAGLPLIDMIECAAGEAQATGEQRVGVLGTKQALRLYHEHLAARGLSAVFLPAERQAAFMDLLYRIKGGDLGDDVRTGMRALAQDLVAAGARTLIAGCTEVPLVIGPQDLGCPLIDSSAALARRCVAVCKGWERL